MKKQWKCLNCKRTELTWITGGPSPCRYCIELVSMYTLQKRMTTQSHNPPDWSPYPPDLMSQNITTNRDKHSHIGAITLFPVNRDDAAGALDNPSPFIDEPVCECGADKAGTGGHSFWCAKYVDPSK